MYNQRYIFYQNVAIFRRRRRRTIMYTPPEREDELQIQINDTKSIEEYYEEYEDRENTTSYRDYLKPDMTKLSPSTRTFGREVISTAATSQSKQTKIGKKIGQTKGTTNNGQRIKYTDENGNVYYREGGTLAWRTNNPGALSFSSMDVAKRFGAVDVYDDGKGHKFGIFATVRDGENAMIRLLRRRSSSYHDNGSKRSIANMIKSIYAPPTENDSRAYANFIKQKTGIDVHNRSVSDLNRFEFNQLVEAIKERELSVSGKIITPKQNEK